MCYYSSGGFSFKDVYDLPVEKRRFFLKLLNTAKDAERAAVEKAQNKPGTVSGESSYPTPQRFNNIKHNIPKK